MEKEKRLLKALFFGSDFELVEQLSSLFKSGTHFELISVSGEDSFKHALNYYTGLKIIIISWDLLGVKALKFIRAARNIFENDSRVVVCGTSISIKNVTKAARMGTDAFIYLPNNEFNIKKQLNFALKSPFNYKEDDFLKSYNEINELISKRNLTEALIYIKKAEKIFGCYESYLNIAYLKCINGFFEESLLYFRRANVVISSNEKLYKQKTIIYDNLNELENYNEAVDELTKIQKSKNFDFETEDVFKCVLDNRPNTNNIYVCLGIYHRKLNNFKKALIAYRKALKLSPNDENIYFNKARIYFLMGQKEKSINLLNKALSVKPNFKEATEFLEEIK